MAVRIRQNGDVVCAAMYPEQRGDIYVDDAVHYHLSVVVKVLVTDDHHDTHGLWFWANQLPDGFVPQEFYRATQEGNADD